MFCENCGVKLEEGARFCGNCGTPVKMEAIPTPPAPKKKMEAIPTPPAPEPEKKKNNKKIIAILAVVIILAIAAGIFMALGGGKAEKTYDEHINLLYHYSGTAWGCQISRC